jgi:hypothetical protein
LKAEVLLEVAFLVPPPVLGLEESLQGLQIEPAARVALAGTLGVVGALGDLEAALGGVGLWLRGG